MRIATYNVEWFVHLFDDHDRLLDDDQPSGRYGISRAAQLAAVTDVFRRLDADAVVVVEAPNSGRRRRTVRALEHFAAHAGIRARNAIMGFANDTQQEIALLYDPAVLGARHVAHSSYDAPQFDQSFAIDLDIDGQTDEVRFSKPPMELALKILRGPKAGQQIDLIGVHLKSKAPHGARTPEEVQVRALANRRKQLAQAIWLRRRISNRLAEDTSLIVAGDLNDGPGLDAYEALFGRSSVEIVMGEDLFDPHARGRRRAGGADHVTARFYNSETDDFFGALLDYILVSPALRGAAQGWQIWHPFDNAAISTEPRLQAALLAASDHFPVTLDLDL
ncbi:Endonuclease/Exonuclease/phosphatase family protein [Tritonibacter multivorans]|uniref:Endonuclease/Exonuclease/phosphatase family protein n=1 Tax=Tritonibacter multivorans TaxID=928856 RepID=A0A0P1GHL9_9RHOB|nr:endonuclease/exonuclease/phosphatase family protein [Tritonibacter multivorans]MDA7420706.1 endonuclease/exonuclease/phosphatase family protein [Tritonibacter multivorans]CUH81090.1 Endonuclease/Exonuclease/phosphatase family protein [Tritonibacter multivorans]SFC28010.1 Endonuclease/Exonuclease/phosphatase family protein [Tritonibacter multivorans]